MDRNPMATTTLTEAEFGQTISENGIVFVDFWADWCPPCKMFGPVFEAASETHTDAVFAKIDTDAERELAGGLGISSIPTLMAFRDGYLVYREAGALNKSQFEKLVQQVKDLDMEKLKAEAEAAKAAS
jgi:thioredoxin 1